jgi:hypothetical protein
MRCLAADSFFCVTGRSGRSKSIIGAPVPLSITISALRTLAVSVLAGGSLHFHSGALITRLGAVPSNASRGNINGFFLVFFQALARAKMQSLGAAREAVGKFRGNEHTADGVSCHLTLVGTGGGAWWRPAPRSLNADSGNAKQGTETSHQGPEEEQQGDEFENVEEKTSHKGLDAPPRGGGARNLAGRSRLPQRRPRGPQVSAQSQASQTRGQRHCTRTLLTWQRSAARARRVQLLF